MALMTYGIVIRLDFEVDIPDVGSAKLELVTGSSLEVGVERPALLEHVGVDDRVV